MHRKMEWTFITVFVAEIFLSDPRICIIVFVEKCISLSAPGRELDKDLQMSCLSMHHLGELPL